MEQQTIRRSFALEGAGIHTGAFGRVTIHPAAANAGIVFAVGATEIPALAEYVVDTARCTTLGKDGATVRTVEHLLSALAGCGIDNARIEVEGPEIPILDGSALRFVDAILEAGRESLGVPAPVLTVKDTVSLEERGSRITASPANGYTLQVTTDFTDWPAGSAVVSYSADDDYRAYVARARTFAFQREVDALIAAGLAKGGSLDNALVITPPDGFSSPPRLPREWAVHKLLDIFGDLALVGARLAVRISADRPGHRINTQFAQHLRRLGCIKGEA